MRMLSRRLLAIATGSTLAIVAMYVLINLGLVNFAPFLNTVQLDVVVSERGTGDPIEGAEVGWLHTEGDEFRVTPIGTTDSSGHLRFEKVIQQQPLWVWPTIGTLRLDGLVLHAADAAHLARFVELRHLLPDQSMGTSEAVVVLELAPR